MPLYVDWGRDPWDPVLMFKLVFLQFLYDLSDRQLEEQATWNLMFKCFLGLSAEELHPDHNTLCRFRQRLGAEEFQRLFNQVVEQARATTFWNRKIITLCNPTMEEGYINIEYERSDRRKFWVPCPHCHGYQVLDFWQVKHQGEKRGEWPKDRQDTEYIKANRVARYECLHCGEEIDDKDKPGLLSRGKWVPEGHLLSPDGHFTRNPRVHSVRATVSSGTTAPIIYGTAKCTPQPWRTRNVWGGSWWCPGAPNLLRRIRRMT